MSSTSEWKYIGTQGVDSGGVIITDPCYIKHWNEVGDDFMGKRQGLLRENRRGRTDTRGERERHRRFGVGA